jgi:hypothetical protein
MRAVVLSMILVVGAAAQPFSAWYGEALRGNVIADLDATGAAQLERTLAANPEDFSTRLKLMAYHHRADRALLSEDRAKLGQHILWLIERHPDHELLHSFVERMEQAQWPPAQYRRAVQLWDEITTARPREGKIQWNAANFFSGFDQPRYLRALEAAAAADPEQSPALRPLAHLYAAALLERGPLTAIAQAGLDASKNRWVLGNAAYELQSAYNTKLQQGEKDTRAAELAERYFLRAKALDPNLDRSKILPQIDLAAIARDREKRERAQRDAPAQAEEALRKMSRLPVQAFPQLPAPVAGVLLARGCTIPQLGQDAAPRNVIRGQFFRSGESGWAVLCSVNRTSALLMFRTDRDTNPDTIKTSKDSAYLQGWTDGALAYSHAITAIDSEDISRNYRTSGGPKPPPMDHQGIDDAFWGKASAHWYFHEGKWLEFPGAD